MDLKFNLGFPWPKLLEIVRAKAYPLNMDTPAPHAPVGRLEALEESEAQLATGRTVSAEAVMRDLRDGVGRLEAKRGRQPKRDAARRR